MCSENGLTNDQGTLVAYFVTRILSLLLLGRAPRAQEGGLSDRQHLLGYSRESSE